MTVTNYRGRIRTILWDDMHKGSIDFYEFDKKEPKTFFFGLATLINKLELLSKGTATIRADENDNIIEAVSGEWTGKDADSLVQDIEEYLKGKSYYISGTNATKKHGGYKTIHFMEGPVVQNFLFIDGGNLNGKESIRIYGGIKFIKEDCELLIDVWPTMKHLAKAYPYKIKVIRKGEPKNLPKKLERLYEAIFELTGAVGIAKKTQISLEDFDYIISVFMKKQRVSVVSNHFVSSMLYSKLYTPSGNKRVNGSITVFDLALAFMDLAKDTYYTPSKRMQCHYKQIAGELIILSPNWKEYMEKIKEMV